MANEKQDHDMNDNRRPMSLLGQSLFDMMNAINRATYETQIVESMRSLKKPAITETIKRVSQQEGKQS